MEVKSGRANIDKGQKHTSPQKEEYKEPQYSQEAIVFNQELNPINGNLLKEILHRSVGAITFLNKYKKLATGSGVLISRNIILTAAHNFYDKQRLFENTDFKFYLGADGKAEEYHEVQAWRYPEEFKTCKPSVKLPHDFAIIKLKKPIRFDKYLPLSQACPDCLIKNNSKLMLQIFGFPSSYPPGHPDFGRSFKGNFLSYNPQDKYGKTIKLNQYGLARQNRISIVDVPQFKLGYGISTLPGQSGSPVVVNDSIIAVHVGGQIGKEFNVGRIIDQPLIATLRNWVVQLNGASFCVEEEYMCEHKKEKQMKLEMQMAKQSKIQTQLAIHQDVPQNFDLSKYASLLESNLNDKQLEQIMNIINSQNALALEIRSLKVENQSLNKQLKNKCKQLQKSKEVINLHALRINYMITQKFLFMTERAFESACYRVYNEAFDYIIDRANYVYEHYS